MVALHLNYYFVYVLQTMLFSTVSEQRLKQVGFRQKKTKYKPTLQWLSFQKLDVCVANWWPFVCVEFAHTFRSSQRNVYGFSKGKERISQKSFNRSCAGQIQVYIQRFSPLSIVLITKYIFFLLRHWWLWCAPPLDVITRNNGDR